MQIEDGTGDGTGLKINKLHEVLTRSVVESEAESATDIGNSYNINSGIVALTGTADSAMLYLKNDEDSVLVIEAIAVGIGTMSATITDSALVTLIRNPTTGTIISDSNVASAIANRNFGSSNTLKSTTLAYSASATGKTFTDGDDAAFFYTNGNQRLFAAIDFELAKGSSIGLKIDLGTSGGANVYAALIVHLKDDNAA